MSDHKSFFLIIWVLIISTIAAYSQGCSCNQISSSPARTGAAVKGAEETGDPDWWKKQPDLKKEETAIIETIKNIRAAFAAKDADKALTYIAPADREKFKAVFTKSPDVLPRFAKDMENATLSFLSLDTDNTLERMAEYEMKVDGYTFYIVFIKDEGKWYLKNF
jgi:hypothetical protein